MQALKERPKKVSTDSMKQPANIPHQPSMSKRKIFLNHCMKFKRAITLGLIALACISIILSIVFSHSGKLNVISESTIKDILKISELSTLEYSYSSIVSVAEDKTTKYHVAYKGNVKAGIDFNKVTLEHLKDDNKVIIKIPNIQITSVNVDNASLDFIFTKEKYDTETVFQEAYKKCEDDLRAKAKANKNLHEMAKDNAISTVKSLLKSWEVQLPEDYTVEYK